MNYLYHACLFCKSPLFGDSMRIASDWCLTGDLQNKNDIECSPDLFSHPNIILINS